MSIYEMIGGGNVVAEAVEAFYAKLRADPVIGEYFSSADVGQLTTHQEMFLTAVLGGPDAYGGRDMRAAHSHLHITDRDFDLFLRHLRDTLFELEAPAARVDEVLDALEPLRLEIVAAPAEGSDEWGSSDETGGGD